MSELAEWAHRTFGDSHFSGGEMLTTEAIEKLRHMRRYNQTLDREERDALAIAELVLERLEDSRRPRPEKTAGGRSGGVIHDE